RMLGLVVPMNVLRLVRLAAPVCLCVLGVSSVAWAEIVVMTSGRPLSVKSHTATEDNTVVLTLRSGGTVTCDRALIDKIVPDEDPHLDPVNPAMLQMPAQGAATPASSSERTSLLRDTVYSSLIAAAAETHGVDP